MIGGGVTGTGVALDAASRGLRIVAAGGARPGVRDVPLVQQARARRPALPREGRREARPRERRRARHPDDQDGTAPHPHVADAVPVARQRAATSSWRACAPATRCASPPRTPPACCPRAAPGRRTRRWRWFPASTRNLTGGLLSYDGQLVDDARLVVALARTAAGYGARIITRAEGPDAARRWRAARDTLTGTTFTDPGQSGDQRDRRLGGHAGPGAPAPVPRLAPGVDAQTAGLTARR